MVKRCVVCEWGLLLQVNVLGGFGAAFETRSSLCNERRGSEPPPAAAVVERARTMKYRLKSVVRQCVSWLSRRRRKAVQCRVPAQHLDMDGRIHKMLDCSSACRHGYTPRHAASAAHPRLAKNWVTSAGRAELDGLDMLAKQLSPDTKPDICIKRSGRDSCRTSGLARPSAADYWF